MKFLKIIDNARYYETALKFVLHVIKYKDNAQRDSADIQPGNGVERAAATAAALEGSTEPAMKQNLMASCLNQIYFKDHIYSATERSIIVFSSAIKPFTLASAYNYQNITMDFKYPRTK